MSNNKEKGGSKKGASSSAGMLPVANAPTSKDGSRLPVAKGHKQKGAGTVIIAKAPVITADGIILKTHEKLPSQLLSEYCQSKQRPKPKYFTQAPAHRFNVTLEDPKNSKHDLSFCPVQSFESDHVARDYAALLALWHFQKIMPLENKLPEPYASTWRQMLRDENGDKKQMASTSQSKASGAVKDASTPDSKNTLTVATLSISSSSTSTATLSSANITVNCVDSTNTLTKSHVKPSNAVVKLDESSDWLCDNCGNQNFATLANGMIRNRCFKCHSAKSANPTLVASVSNIKPSTATSVDSIKNESIVPVKATPIAVLDLKRDTSSRFISASEQRQQRSKGQQEARNKRAFFDALRRANKPDFIFLCSRLKRKLEAFLGSSGDLDNCALISGVATKSDVHIIYLPLPELLKRLESSIPDLGKNGSNSSTVPLSLFSQSAISLSIADQSKVLSVSVVSSLRSQEFGDDAISNALQFVFTSSSIRNKIISELHEQDEISAITTLSSQFADLVQESCLEYLCLYLNEEDLPESMDGRNFEAKPKLQLYKNPDTSSSSSSSMNGKLMKDKSPMIEEDMMETLTIGIQHSLTLFGCDSVTINAIDVVMSRINLSVASLPLNNMICSLALLSSFWQLYKAIPLSLTEVKVDECTNYFKLITTSQDQSLSPDVNLDIVTEEVSMLQAIFGEETCVYLFHNESVHEYRLCIDLNSISPSLFDIMSFIFGTKTAALASCNNLVLHLFIPKFLTYPTQPPIALLTIASNLNPSKDMLTSYNIDTDSMIPSIERRATLQLLQLEIQSKILEILMEPVMFTLAGFVKDDLGDSFKRKYYPTSSLNTLSGQSIFSNVTTFSSSLTSTSNEMTSNDSTLSVEEYLKKVFITFITTLSTVESAPTEILTTPADDDYAQIDDEDEDITTIASHSDNTSVANRNTHSVKKSMLRPQGRSFWDTALLRTPTSNTSASINTPERRKMAEIRKSLPAFKSRLQFLKTMSLGSCCIVTGETGCGKSTQTPQFLMEEYPTAKIVVCQPRRLAAIGVATRVAEEYGCKLGQEVGYMVKGDSKATDTTRLVFCTYGVLLRRLQDDEFLTNISFVVLDEVHERGVDSDFALALLVSAMASRPSLKLILMSATISTDKFAAYIDKSFLQSEHATSSSNKQAGRGKPAFGPINSFSIEAMQNVLPGFQSQISSSIENYSEEPPIESYQNECAPIGTRAPVLFIPGYTFPVTEFYKNDFEQIVSKFMDALLYTDKSGGSTNGDDDDDYGSSGKGYYQRLLRQQQARKNEINYLLMAQLAVYLAIGCNSASENSSNMLSTATGCILIFLPGVHEISKLMQLIDTLYEDVTAALHIKVPRLKLLPLHGGLTPQDQKQVFELVSADELKIVVSTNVAEASVTLSDVTVVIDSCRVKEVALDPERGVPALVTQLCSQDSLRQRRGRAGRVQAGRCFRLITENTFQKLPAHSIPEILRVPLENVVLQIKSMPKYASEEASRILLNRCIDPPMTPAVMQAEQNLIRLQALNKQKELSPLGRHLSKLPCSPNIGRMLIYGAMVGCLSPAVSIAATMNVRTPFLSGGDEDVRRRVDQAKRRLENNWITKMGGKRLRGDFLIVVQAIIEFTQCGGGGKQRQYAYTNGLSFERMQEIVTERQELLQNLMQTGFIASARSGTDLNSFENRNSSSVNIVVSVCVAGLYPHIARVIRPPQRFVETLGGNVERDAVATEFKVYIPAVECTGASSSISGDNKTIANNTSRNTQSISIDRVDDDITTEGFERVFIHPSSINFGNSLFKHTSYLLYGELQLTASNQKNVDTAKVWLRETLEPTVYSLLLFGGQLDVSYKDQRIYLDNWIRFSAPGRIVALVGALRSSLDTILAVKLSNPSYDLSESVALRLATELLESDGLH